MSCHLIKNKENKGKSKSKVNSESLGTIERMTKSALRDVTSAALN